MRVCMVNDNYYRGSGVAIAVRRIVHELPDVQFFFAGCDPEGLPEDITWMPPGTYKRFELKTPRPFQLLQALFRFRRWFKRNQCDLAHCHHRRIAVLLQLAGLPVLYTGHLAFPQALWFRWLAPRTMTAVTPSVAANILETTGRRVVTCIGNPIPFPAQPPSFAEFDGFTRAVCIGRLDTIKGHTYLLAAWKLLLDRGHRYELELIGEGPLESSLREQCRVDGTEHLVHFRGFTQDVSSVITKSLFAILLSEVEGQGIVTLEAAALGRPSLLTYVPGSMDLLPPERKLPNGLKYRDVEAAANAIEAWFAQPEHVISEGQTFFNFLKHTSSPSRIAGQYREVYRTLCDLQPH